MTPQAHSHDSADPRRPRPQPVLARRGRRWLFTAWFVGTAFMFGAAWLFGRVFEPERIGMVETVLVFPVVYGILVFASLAWLAWIVFGPTRGGGA